MALLLALLKVKVLQEQRGEGEALRRQLNGTILDLKGNIRVFCRVAPGENPVVEVKQGEQGPGSVEVLVTMTT